MTKGLVFVFLSLLSFGACSSDKSDSGVDAAVDADAGETDAGQVDAGVQDDDDTDAGTVEDDDLDAGTLEDEDLDAGGPDEDEPDAGTPDAGDPPVGPTAVIEVLEGEEVIPQTDLHLVGSGSLAGSSSIASYEWTVEQPTGSQSVFVPDAATADPTFEANVAGSYVFRLTVTDSNNPPLSDQAEYTVIVIPDEAIHIALLWDTPNDPDQTDTGPDAGADLDLHLVHPLAQGYDYTGDGQPDGWYCLSYDCFWNNPAPDWGSLDPMVDDNPSLDRDDTDGAGPENINLNIPEEGLTYRVGVHYFNDHEFGESLATVRVYIQSVLVFEASDVALARWDLWEVCTIHWPSGVVTPVTGPDDGPLILPNCLFPKVIGK